MQIDPQVIDLAQRAKAANVRMSDVLAECGVAVSTWWRWRERGADPKLTTLRRLQAALDARIGAQDRAA